jgi:cystathionine beta-lyase
MSNYSFDQFIDRSQTSDAKTSAALIMDHFNLNYYEDTISMWVADMDFACPPAVIDSIKARADQLIIGYTKPSDTYQNSIINWYDRRHDMKIQKDWLVFSNGTVSAVRNSLRAFTKEGNGVIIQPPIYYPFKREIQETKRNVIENHLVKDDNNQYRIDFEDFEKKCKDPNTTMFIYCNPHNPIGQIWSTEDTTKLIAICQANDVLFFSDEIHCDLIREGQSFESALNLTNYKNLIVATAVNKTFNVAGLHITNLVIPNEELREKLTGFTGSISLSPFAMEATIAAYDQSEDWLVELNKVLDDNLCYMDTFIQNKLPKIKFNKPTGTYLTWLDFSAYGIQESELLSLIADEAHLILEGGSMFGQAGTGFIRMNISCPKHILIEALNRLEKTFSNL